jgi:putative GTP pyrophosphokinase
VVSEIVRFAPLPGTSRSQIKRCGETLRCWWATDDLDGDEHMGEVLEAFRVMIEFRETFQAPMSKTATGLRSMVKSEWPELARPGARIPVVQRLKRREQILNKLSRLQNTDLSNMGDIGGCRAVLKDREMVDRVARRIRKNWTIHGRVRDTRDEPGESGYRGLHFIVVRDGRRVEIQLRDPREQEWAVAVERTGARLGFGLKEGEGPAELKEYFRLASLGMYRESQGENIDDAFRVEFDAARDAVRPYFER